MIGPVSRHPQGPGGFVTMIRYGPGLWEFHPNIHARHNTLADAEAAAQQVPPTLEVRIYRCHGGNLIRVR